MPGFSPYVQAAQQQATRQSPYSRYRPNLSSAVTGPTDSGGTGGGSLAEAQEARRAELANQVQATQARTERENEGNRTAVAQNEAGIMAYRAANASGPGAARSKMERTQATELGIDPSSSGKDIADVVNRQQGGDFAQTPINLDPTKPAPSTGIPGQALPDSADVATAAAAAQNAKDGGQDSTLANSYSKGYMANQPMTGQTPTGVNPYTAGAATGGPPAPAMPPTPPLTLKMPAPDGMTSPPMTQVGAATPTVNVNAPLKATQIKPFGVASTQRRRQPVAAPAILP